MAMASCGILEGFLDIGKSGQINETITCNFGPSSKTDLE
jgi:hypothetical protein